MLVYWPLFNPMGETWDDNKEKMWVRGWEMRGEEKPDNAIDAAERTGMTKHWKARDVSTGGTRMEMTAGGVRESSYDNSADCRYAMPVYDPVL